MTNVKVYTLPVCPNCKMLKQFLQSQNIEFTEINMESPLAMTELYSNNVYTTTAPVLQINNEFYINLEIPGQTKDILKAHNLIYENK